MANSLPSALYRLGPETSPQLGRLALSSPDEETTQGHTGTCAQACVTQVWTVNWCQYSSAHWVWQPECKFNPHAFRQLTAGSWGSCCCWQHRGFQLPTVAGTDLSSTFCCPQFSLLQACSNCPPSSAACSMKPGPSSHDTSNNTIRQVIWSLLWSLTVLHQMFVEHPIRAGRVEARHCMNFSIH